MQRLKHVVVEGLFGYMKHEIDIREHDPTIITAPNGAGKTHLLLLIRAALGQDFASLFRSPYERLTVQFYSNEQISIKRSEGVEKVRRLDISVRSNGRTRNFHVDETLISDEEGELPSWLTRRASGNWYDARGDRILTNEWVERRYRTSYRRRIQELSDKPAYRDYIRILGPARPIMIDTKRLDAIVPRSPHVDRETFRPGDPTVASSNIVNYIDEIRLQVVEARRSSIRATQSADLSFAARALAAAKATVKESSLHKKYDDIVEKYEELARNGLAVGEAPLEFPKETTPTVRRILNVFLDDWEKRLQPLWPLNEKLRTLRDIIDAKLKQSGKSTSMTERGVLTFVTSPGRNIKVSSLSSGEQHLIALFTNLLFTAHQGSVVLIDEPEISMHAAWKHAFLEDIGRVANLADLQVILATHSSGIINGRWDLTEELIFSGVNAGKKSEEADSDLESEDILD